MLDLARVNASKAGVANVEFRKGLIEELPRPGCGPAPESYRLGVGDMSEAVENWVPEACTLPTVDRPLRLGEFDALFNEHLRGQERVSPSLLRWSLDPSSEAAARDLTTRETQCCAFFRFGFTVSEDALLVDVRVPTAQIPILDALAERAASGIAR